MSVHLCLFWSLVVDCFFFFSGADQASVTAQTSLQVAQSHVNQIRQLFMEAEKKLKESKAEDSQRIKLPAAMEEEDIPEAYLRED